MKRKKYIVITVLTMVLASIFSFFFIDNDIQGHLNPKNIEFKIFSNQIEYLKGEYIWINIRVINNSDQNYYVRDNLAIGAGLEIIVNDSQGKKIPNPIFDSFEIEKYDSFEFLPKDTLESIQNLDWFRLNHNKSINEYTIIAQYNGLTSNQIHFKVIEPEGEEKRIYEFIKRYDKERVFKGEGGQDLDSEAISLINQFPNSRYIPIIYEQLLSTMVVHYSDFNSFEKYFDDYMRKYPGNASSGILINIYRVKLKMLSNDKNMIRAKIEELKIKYGNAILNSEIDRYIKRNIDYEKFWFKK